MAYDSEDIESVFGKLNKEYCKSGLTINLNKTEYLCIDGERLDIELENVNIIKSCNEFVYIRITIDNTGRCVGMIDGTIDNTRKNTGTLDSKLWQKNIEQKPKCGYMIQLLKVHYICLWSLAYNKRDQKNNK